MKTEVSPRSHHTLEIPLNPQRESPPAPLTPYLPLLEISVCVLKESLFYLWTLPRPHQCPSGQGGFCSQM